MNDALTRTADEAIFDLASLRNGSRPVSEKVALAKTLPTKRIRVLCELRPALEGYAGIPQETRLLFANLRKIEGLSVEGLLQGPRGKLARGIKKNPKKRRFFRGPIWNYNRFSKVVVSLSQKPHRSLLEIAMQWLQNRADSLALNTIALLNRSSVKLTRFHPRNFEDFVWRTIFAKTLSVSEFANVTAADHQICAVSWYSMHVAGINSLNWRFKPRYPRIDTRDVDILVAQTPFPGRVGKSTNLIVRYHDAIPVFYPHTINDRSHHQASHVYALMSNVDAGAWFACVSEATRQALVEMFPQAADRSVTIHNIVSDQYYTEESDRKRVPVIIRTRLHEGDGAKGIKIEPKFLSLKEKEAFYHRKLHGTDFNYLLVVSSIEPRKNHSRLLGAWEIVKQELDQELKLLVVGGLGWDFVETLRIFKPWIDRGELFMLSSVPAPDLRVLYRHAAATVCPSLAEGFDFAGIESMRSGGVTVASDIPVHREIYGDAADYFNPYSTTSLVESLCRVLYDDTAQSHRAELRKAGVAISERYLPNAILPQWEDFLGRVTGKSMVPNSVINTAGLVTNEFGRNGNGSHDRSNPINERLVEGL
jgi:glycosyltransferase involved in cell wall biosynthesis